MDKSKFLKKLNEIVLLIEKRTKEIEEDKTRQVKLYELWTRQVNDAVKNFMQNKEVPQMKNWDPLQKDLFFIYKKLIKI